jgi:hypothetical protein
MFHNLLKEPVESFPGETMKLFAGHATTGTDTDTDSFRVIL